MILGRISPEGSRVRAPGDAQYPIVSGGGTQYYRRAAGCRHFTPGIWRLVHINAGAIIVRLRKLRYLNLLAVIIAMMIISPFTARSPVLRVVNNVVLTLVMLSVVNTVRSHRAISPVGLMLGVPWVLLFWLHLIDSITIPPAILSSMSMLFQGYIIFVLLRHIIRAKRVTADILYGAVSVYILLGVFFTSLYFFLDAVTLAELFVYAGAGTAGGPVDGVGMFYFSFVTLTTLGYGDIQPVADVARIFAIIEAMTGVLYTATLIGRLIGMYIAQSGSNVEKDPGRDQ